MVRVSKSVNVGLNLARLNVNIGLGSTQPTN